jgi:hypothetical protein
MHPAQKAAVKLRVALIVLGVLLATTPQAPWKPGLSGGTPTAGAPATK